MPARAGKIAMSRFLKSQTPASAGCLKHFCFKMRAKWRSALFGRWIRHQVFLTPPMGKTAPRCYAAISLGSSRKYSFLTTA